MDGLITIMSEIREQLVELNGKIDILTNYGNYDLADVCIKLDTIDSSLSMIDTTISCIDK